MITIGTCKDPVVHTNWNISRPGLVITIGSGLFILIGTLVGPV